MRVTRVGYLSRELDGMSIGCIQVLHTIVAMWVRSMSVAISMQCQHTTDSTAERWRSPMNAKNYSRLAAMVFAFIAAAQLLRAVSDFPITAGATSIPVWVSWLAGLAAAALAWVGFTSSRA